MVLDKVAQRVLLTLAKSMHAGRRGDAAAASAAAACLAGLHGAAWQRWLCAAPAASATLVSSLVACLPSAAAVAHGEAPAPPELQVLGVALLSQFIVHCESLSGGAPDRDSRCRDAGSTLLEVA